MTVDTIVTLSAGNPPQRRVAQGDATKANLVAAARDSSASTATRTPPSRRWSGPA